MEMLLFRDIRAISIPFSAGVALAAYLPLGDLSLYLCSTISCAASLLCLALLCRRTSGTVIAAFTFLFAGMFVCCSSRLSITSTQTPEIAVRALGRFVEMIDQLRFRDTETAALLKALLCGDRSGLSRDILEAFRVSGATHILSLSGFHMGVIYAILSKCLFFCGNSPAGKSIRSCSILACCSFYCVMTGAGESVTRALLFIILNECSSLSSGREKSPLNVFCAALMIQLLMSPLSIKSIGFQLSYMAMLGIYTLYPIMKAWFPHNGWRAFRKLWDSCALSISCQVFTSGLVWIYFESFPIYFLIANLITLPLTEAFICSSCLCIFLNALGICPMIIKNLAEVFGQIMIFCIETIASIS